MGIFQKLEIDSHKSMQGCRIARVGRVTQKLLEVRRGRNTSRRTRLSPLFFHINHRHHLNLAWERQAREDEALAPEVLNTNIIKNEIVSVRNLRHLDALLDAAGGRLTILALYSTSCGICKVTRCAYESICRDSHHERARVVYLEHDINDEFDFPSDIAQYYRVKKVPTWLVFVDGAMIDTFCLPDIRHVGVTRSVVQGTMVSSETVLRKVFWRILVRTAPSARR